MKQRPAALLFDLDGTLIDSAPDLAGTANEMRRDRGLADLPYAELRSMVGAGARGMVGLAFGVQPDDTRFVALRDEFLDRYQQRMLHSTHVFEAVVPVLEELDRERLPWGIVTNKAQRFAEPVVRHLGLHERAAVLICGDTTPYAKPHPEPLLEAARRMGLESSACVYVGDDLRDVQAGRAAGMKTLAAAWGYLGAGEPVHAWGADGVIEEPHGVLEWLRVVATRA